MQNMPEFTTPVVSPCAIWVNNPFDCSQHDLDTVSGLTILEYLDSTRQWGRMNNAPTVCYYKGRQLMRREFDQVIDAPVVFYPLPQGGDSGSNPMQIISTIALIAAAVYTGGAAGVAMQSTQYAAYAGIVEAVVTAGVMIAGSMLINTMFPPPSAATGSASSASPTYSLGAQGNMARPGAPIPVSYGKVRMYPDFAAQPYSEFANNEQYLYQLFCIGQGESEVSDIRFDNTPVANFSEVQYQIVKPHEKVTLFHSAVITAPEAGGQELNEPIVFGPYIVNKVGTEVSRLAVDVAFPGGLIGMDDEGDEYSVSVHFRITAEPVNDQGDPVGGTIVILDGNVTDRTRTPKRLTFSKDVDPGRYQVTVQRTTALGGRTEIRNAQLGAIRGYLVDDNEYGDVTLLAMRARATASLSSGISQKVNCIVEHLIPVWRPDSGWSRPRLTRNPAWAFADACRSRYGGDYSDTQVDLPGLWRLAQVFDARKDTFDGVFDSESNLWDGLNKIGQVCRSCAIRHGNVMRLARDEPRDVASAMFSMSNIADFRMTFAMPTDNTADAVRMLYRDQALDYAQQEVLCCLPDSPAITPKDVDLFGCCNRDQAYREGMYLIASNRLRRQTVSFTTGMEGYIPSFGDLVVIQHDLLSPDGSYAGFVTAAENQVLVLSQAVELDSRSWYLTLRDSRGAPSKPLACEQIDSTRVRVTEDLPFAPVTGADEFCEPTHFILQPGKAWQATVKVTGIRPEAGDRVKITGAIEDPQVHKADEGEVPIPPVTPPQPDKAPVISDLMASQGGTTATPRIYLSWSVAGRAEYYQVERSTDGRQTWQLLGSPLLPQFDFTTDPGPQTIRVAGLAALRGEWAYLDIDAGSDFSKPDKVVITAEPFVGDALKLSWPAVTAAARYRLQVVYDGHIMRDMYLPFGQLSWQYHYTDAEADGAGRTLTIRMQAENANGVAGDWSEGTFTNAPAATPSNFTISPFVDSFAVTVGLPAEPDIKELRVYGSTTQGFTPDASTLLATSQSTRVDINQSGTWYFRAAWLDRWGPDGLNYTGEQEATSSKVDISDWFPITETQISDDSISTPKLQANAVEADKISANAVTAEKINVSQLSAISANMGTVTGGTFKTDAAIGHRVELSSLGDLPIWMGTGDKTRPNGKFYYDTQTDELVFRGELELNSGVSGGRMEMTNRWIRVYDENNVLRVEIGELV